jgi:DNA-binding response OmpR family regulator
MIDVLVAEDDPRVGAELIAGLRRHGFATTLVTTCAGLIDEHTRNPPRVVVLDLGLADGDALDLLPRLCAPPGAIVIVLTARVDLDARLDAFRGGAADFVSKPFFLAELVARIRARTGAGEPRAIVTIGDVTLDPLEGLVRRGGELLELTPTERTVLAYLVARPGRAVSRAALLEHVLPPHSADTERAVDVHVSRLRKKLGADAGKHLETVWGVGWRFVP